MTVELKSVNHRYLDLSFRMPRHISFAEDTLRTALNDSLSRGHVDVYVNYRNTRSDAKEVRIDTALLGAYLKSVKAAAAELREENDMTLSNALRLPDVTDIVEADEDDEAVKALTKEAVDKAIAELITARRGEGERLANDLTARLATVDELRGKIETRAPMVVEEYRIKLNERIEAMLGGTVEVDAQRLATEVALFADKASIDEELVRLKTHTDNRLDDGIVVGFLVLQITALSQKFFQHIGKFLRKRLADLRTRVLARCPAADRNQTIECDLIPVIRVLLRLQNPAHFLRRIVNKGCQ